MEAANTALEAAQDFLHGEPQHFLQLKEQIQIVKDNMAIAVRHDSNQSP